MTDLLRWTRCECFDSSKADKSTQMNQPVSIRPAVPADLPAIMTVIDGSLLAMEAATVQARINGTPERVLVADVESRIIGVLVLDRKDEIEAIAVRRARRDQGVGTALVEGATERHGTLTAAFRQSVRPFYESLDFEITENEKRCRAVRADR